MEKDTVANGSTNGHVNGLVNGHNNGNSNGTANGHINGHTNGNTNGHTTDSKPVHLELDALIVGAGFAGVYLLYQLRKQGFQAKIVEAGHGLGGVWHWSNYPGARVDTQYPSYALNIPEVYSTWSWTQEYPSGQELKDYFQHIDNVINVSKDTFYGSRVVKATFDESSDKWTVETDNGHTFTSRFFVCCLGFSAKCHIPDWPGLKDDFQGQVVHSNFWPAEGIDMRGKKVAIVGTGPTGLQIGQEAPRTADQVTCFVRSPNLSWPMGQRPIAPERALKDRERMGYLLGEERFTRIGGMLYEETTRKVFDEDAEQRELRLGMEYKYGGFRFFFEAYIDVLLDQAANDEIYHFWRRRVHDRMADKRKAEILAPEKPPYPFAGKRPSLEQDYYEQMDRSNVTLVDVNSTPVTHVVSNGIVTADGTVHEADLIVMATGFDAITGGIKNIDITGLNGLTINEKWSSGTHAYLGLTVSGFPNFFYTYGPLSPSAYSSGPSTVESQSDWIIQAMRKMQTEGLTRINATEEAESEWKILVNTVHAMTLRENVEGSWYLGLNIPGKAREPLCFGGGLPFYRSEIKKALVPDWKGFMALTKAPSTSNINQSTMSIPVQTITSFRTAFSPFSPLARPCRLVLNMLQTPSSAPVSSATHIKIQVSHLPRNSTQLPEMTVGFKGGKEIKLEVGKRKMKIGDVVDEIARVGRVIEREESLKS